MPMKLFDLFPNLTTAWPGDRVRFEIGDFVAGPDQAIIAARLAELNNIIEVLDPHFGAEGGVGMEARLRVDNSLSADSESFLFALKAMPRVGFRLLDTDPIELPRLLVVQQDDGVEIVIEGLPVQIELPIGFVSPPRDEDDDGLSPFPPDVARGTFLAGHLDTQKVTYREDDPTTIQVHIRVVIDKELDIIIVPAVPITFEACTFLEGIPVKGVYDFHLLPSPGKARQWLPWIRHSVSAWFEGVVGDYEGAFAARHVWLDPKAGWVGDVSKWLNEHSDKDPTAEFVIDDLVVPFMIPIPRHATLGIRRSLEDVADVADIIDFEQAPVVHYFRRSAPIGFLINELFLRSQSAENFFSDGIQFDLALFFGEEAEDSEDLGNPTWSAGIQLADEGTLLATLARDMDDIGDVPGLDWKFGGTGISIVRGRTGVSITRLARGEGFGSSFVFVVDILVSSEAEEDGEDDFPVQIKGLSGSPLQVVMEGIGWWFGPSIEGAGFPGGVQIVFGDAFRITIEELGIATRENGGHYLVISAGLGVKRGEFRVRGMRFKLGGSPDAPRFGIDGFFGRIDADTFELEVGGYFEDRREGGLRIKEFGFTGTLKLKMKGITVAIDLIIGHISGTQDFKYFMVQAYVGFVIPIGSFELLSIRALFADDMQPKLSPADEDSHDLRYYQWYRRTDPTVVSGSRRLDAWEAMKDAWGIGVGVGASVAGMGDIINLRIFVLGIDRPEGGGFLFTGEAFLLEGTTPIAYLVLEWDGEEDQFSFLLGVDITLDKFVKEVPDWLGGIIQLTGTLLISTNPTIVAIGRIKDPLTWFRFKVEADLWLAKAFTEVAFCFEVQTGPEDFVGTTLSIRMAGAGVVGPGLLEFYVGWGIYSASFSTGSMAYAAEAWAECGIKYRLFGFLNFGAKVGADIHLIGDDPAYAVFELFIEIETPWFLPDVELRIEKDTGRLATGEIGTVTAPLRSASSLIEASEQTAPLFVSPAELVAMSPQDPASGETARAKVMSIVDVRDLTVPGRNARVQSFLAAKLPPVATDATIQIAFVVPVNDCLGLGSSTARRTQVTGELSLEYDLVGLEIRRRPRFDASAPWTPLAERTELDVELGPGGPVLTGSFDPLPFTGFWEDVAVGGDSVAQRLLLNATTPFTFVVNDEAADESLLDRHPNWPCCSTERKPGSYDEHVLTFNDFAVGAPLPATVPFEDTESVLRSLYPSLVRPASFTGSSLPAGTLAALYPVERAGVVFRIRFDTPVAWVDLRPSWLPGFTTATLALILMNDDSEVARVELPLSGTRHPINVRLVGDRPGTECLAVIQMAATAGGSPLSPPGSTTMLDNAPMSTAGRQLAVEFDRIAYTPWANVVEAEAKEWLCGTIGDRGFAGDGKIGFLPNHQYEIALTTRVSLAHATAGTEEAEYTQFVYFETKGLPGLNAVPRIGAEVEPYVASQYPAERCLIYRNEPIALAFTEQLNVVVPLADRPPGPASDERDVLMQLALVVKPDVAETPDSLVGATGEDWIVAHRTLTGPVVVEGWSAYKHQITASLADGRLAWSDDARRVRLAGLIARPGGTCDIPDPRIAPAGLLMHEPFGSAPDGDPLWPARSRYTATVVPDGAAFVDRQPFRNGDQSAFEYRTNSGAGDTSWSVADDGALVPPAGGRRYAIFGEPDWDHIEIQAGFVVEGTAAGIVSAVPAGSAVIGWAAVVEREGSDWFLALRQRASVGAAWQLAAREPLPMLPDDRPTTLQLTLFDDRLRATVGETQVEAPRGAHRHGRLALLAEGVTRFTGLLVRGLSMFQFPVQVSRFVDFDEHIGSFSGELDEIEPSALGDAPSQTVSGLLSQTSGDISRLMSREADPAERQELFDRWTVGLGVPFRQTLEGVSLSSYRPDGSVRALVLESPEPLRFTHEVALTAERWYRDRRPRWPFYDIRVARAADDSLDLELHLAERTASHRFRFARVEEDDRGERRYRVYEGSTTWRADRLRFRSDHSHVLEGSSTPGRSLGAALSDVRPGMVAILDRVRDVVVGSFDPGRIVTVPVHFVILTDAAQQNALFIPTDAGATVALAAGNYRLEFSIARERWQSLDGGSADQRLSESAVLNFRL